MRKKTKPYAVGQRFKNSVIEELLVADGNAYELTYAVNYTCCGKKAVQTHYQIRQRETKPRAHDGLCWQCVKILIKQQREAKKAERDAKSKVTRKTPRGQARAVSNHGFGCYQPEGLYGVKSPSWRAPARTIGKRLALR